MEIVSELATINIILTEPVFHRSSVVCTDIEWAWFVLKLRCTKEVAINAHQGSIPLLSRRGM